MFKLQLIDTETLIIFEEKIVTNFKDVRYILGNSHLLDEALNAGNKKVKVLYNDIELFSYTEQLLLYPLEFNDLFNKIDFNLLNFSSIALLLQQNKLRSPLLKQSLIDFDRNKLGNLQLLKFKNGINLCVDDIEVDGYTNHEVKSVIKNSKLEISLVDNETNNISKQFLYDFNEISKICYLETNNGIHFEVFLTF